MKAAMTAMPILTSGTAGSPILRHPFAPADVQRLPLCRTLHCQLGGRSFTEDKDTGANRRTRYRYRITPAGRTPAHPLVRLTVLIDDTRHVAKDIQLKLTVPGGTPTRTDHRVVLTWGDSREPSAANLAQCLPEGGHLPARYTAFASLDASLDGSCFARTRPSGQIDFLIDMSSAEQFSK